MKSVINQKLTKSGKMAFIAPIRWIILTGIVFFISAGEINILRAWIYIGLYSIGGLLIGIILFKNSPALLNDRGKIQKGTKNFDKVIIVAFFIFAIIVTPLLAGIDYRLGLYLIPFHYLYIAVILYVVSAFLSVWSMLHNPFFEGTVRIQKEKNHYVINTGPYKTVRHPGYVGMLIGTLPLPFAFGSLLSFIPVSIMIILVFIRTHYEDKILQKELDGYKEYSNEVKYKLIPFFW